MFDTFCRLLGPFGLHKKHKGQRRKDDSASQQLRYSYRLFKCYEEASKDGFWSAKLSSFVLFS